MSLQAFFDTVVPFLKGETDFETISKLGTSASEPARFLFYRDLMRANVHRVVEYMFRSLKTALNDEHEGKFAQLVDAYRVETPPAGWDLNSLTGQFPAFLEKKATIDVEVPKWAAEVADWSFTRYSLGCALAPEHAALLAPTSIRSYLFDLPKFEKEILKDNSVRPEQSPTTLIVWRNLNGGVRHQQATAPQVLALAAACEQAPDSAIAAIGEDALAAATETLVKWGILRGASLCQ